MKRAQIQEQEYAIQGTVPEMVLVLQQDFDMTYDEAKFFVYSIIKKQGVNEDDYAENQELDTWYLTAEEGKYEGQILNSHYVINFTNIKKYFYHTAYIFLVKHFFSKGIDLVLIGADLLYTIVASIEKIEDMDYCVYAQIVKLCIGDSKKLFDKNEIKTKNKDGKCDYQDDTWKCTYLGKNEDCVCDKAKIDLAFAHLEKQNIIKPIGEKWMLVR